MIDKAFPAVVLVVIVAVAGTAVYLNFGTGPSNSTNPSFSELKAGINITITKNDAKMLGGAAIVNFETNGYYAVKYNLDLEHYTILTGSWKSTGDSLIWIIVHDMTYASTPLPDATKGILNQTLVPGQYTLVIGGHPGDVITITDTIQIQSYVPQQVSNFSLPAGTHIGYVTTYSIYLSQPGELVGIFTTPPGTYYFSLYNSSGLGFSYGCSNSSAQPTSFSFKLGPGFEIFGSGYYNLTFSAGFYISQTLQFLYFYDYSTC